MKVNCKNKILNKADFTFKDFNNEVLIKNPYTVDGM